MSAAGPPETSKDRARQILVLAQEDYEIFRKAYSAGTEDTEKSRSEHQDRIRDLWDRETDHPRLLMEMTFFVRRTCGKLARLDPERHSTGWWLRSVVNEDANEIEWLRAEGLYFDDEDL